jgi:hypothetical protein
MMQLKTLGAIGTVIAMAGGLVVIGLNKGESPKPGMDIKPQVNTYARTADGKKVRVVGNDCAVVVELAGPANNPTIPADLLVLKCRVDAYMAEAGCQKDCVFDLLAHTPECCKVLRGDPGYVGSTIKELIAHPKGKRVLVTDGTCEGKDTPKGLPTTYTCAVPWVGTGVPRFPHSWAGLDMGVGQKEATMQDEVAK